MNRRDVIQKLVLNSICDDFENIDQTILADVAAVGAESGLAIHRTEVVEALTRLVQNGFAKAYVLTGTEASPFDGELQGMPSITDVEENFQTYFYATERGRALHLSDAWPRRL